MPTIGMGLSKSRQNEHCNEHAYRVVQRNVYLALNSGILATMSNRLATDDALCRGNACRALALVLANLPRFSISTCITEGED